MGIADVPLATGVAEQGFASIFMRAATMMMHEQQQSTLERWSTPPLLLVRPRVSHIGWFSFQHVDELLQVGYECTRDALRGLTEMLAAPGGVFPRQPMSIAVDGTRCTGCGLCVARHPELMRLEPGGRAAPIVTDHDFSPADAFMARCCPEGAITVAAVGERETSDVRRAQSA